MSLYKAEITLLLILLVIFGVYYGFINGYFDEFLVSVGNKFTAFLNGIPTTPTPPSS